MKVFVTGVAGFLGSWIAEEMLKDGHYVTGIDNLIGGDMENVPLGVNFFKMDCNELPKGENARIIAGYDLVFHCAATAYEGLSVFSPALVTRHIVGASVATFSAAIAGGVKRIVHCSSMARYGALTPPFREDMTPHPQDPYGIGKLCAEQLLRNLCETHGVEYVIAVPHNIIGPRQKYDDPYRNVASIMINRCLQGYPPLVYGDGSQRRCFSYISDCLSCLRALAYQGNVVGHVINIGPDEQPVSINELAALVRVLTDFDGPGVVYAPPRPQEVHVALCSSNKARWMLGYSTSTSLRAGLIQMIDFIKERGPKPFKYHLPIEIISDKTPRTWLDHLI